MSASIVRFGVIGTGHIAHDFVTAIGPLQSAVVAAVGSRSLTRAEEFASGHAIAAACGSYEDLVNRDDVDVVYVATHVDSHRDNAMLALKSGKGVLCEKTFTRNSQEAKELVDEAKKRDVFLMEANWLPFWPLVQKTREMIKEGKIGDVVTVQANLGFRADPSFAPSLFDSKICGGSLYACGCYTVAMAELAFEAQPHTVKATAVFRDGVDLHTSALFGYEDEKVAVLQSSIQANIPSDAVIVGTKGKITIHGLFVCPLKLTVEVDGEEPLVLTDELPPNDGKFNFPNSQGLIYEAKEVVKCIQEGKKQSAVMTWERSLNNMHTMDRIISSSKE